MPKYLHELPEWPRFQWDEGAFREALPRIHFAQGNLIGKLEALGFGERQSAAFEAIVQEVRRTSQIEGENLDEAQIRSSVAKRLGIDVAGLPKSDRSIDGVVEMVLDATQNYDKRLTAARLCDWHALLFPQPRHRANDLRIGVWRDDRMGPMQVVSGPIGREKVHFQAPGAKRLDGEIASFLNWFEVRDGTDKVLRAGIAHLWFETLHPFDDGNGRIGRAVMDMALARSEQRKLRAYSMSAQIQKERNRYYDELEAAQKGTLDISRWLAWFLECLERALKASEETLAGVLARNRFWKGISGIDLNPRQRKVLERLQDGFEGKLTSAKWAKLGKCSHDTALRDIKDLLTKGVLGQADASGRATSYFLRTAEP